MKKNLSIVLCAILTGILVIAGCGGGGAVSPGAAPGAAKGAITDFGSVILDDTLFGSSSATVSIDDVAGAEDDLRKGQVVRIRGTISADGASGIATTIEFDQDLEGPVSSINTATSSFVVLGRTVIVDGGTIIKDESGSQAADDANPSLTLADLAGRMVEVSGFIATGGVIVATRVERKPGAFVAGVTIVEIKGTVANLNDGASLFTIGSLTIDYNGIVPQGVLAFGVNVEVEGTIAAAGAGTIAAISVEVEDDGSGAAEGETSEVEGLVTAFTSETIFSVDGQPVEAAGAEFSNGDKADLALNVRVEVEGTLVGGVLQAREVSFKGSRVKMEGTVTAYTAPLLTIFGLNVRTNAFTETVGVLGTGTAKIRGYVSGGEIVATRVEMTDVSIDDWLQGPVDPGSVAGNTTFAILGVTVDTTGLADAAFQGEDVQLGRAAFFALLTAGRVAKAKGSFAGGTITAAELEVDD